MPSDSVTLVGTGALARLIIPSSFVSTIDRKSLASPMEFRVGKGGWIVQAKANIRGTGHERNLAVQLLLSASADTLFKDDAKVSVNNLNYATVVATLGFPVSSTALIQLSLSGEVSGGGGGAEYTPEVWGIIITAIHQDDLTIFAM